MKPAHKVLVVFFTFLLLSNVTFVTFAADQTTVEHQIPHEWIGGGSALGLNGGDDNYNTIDLPFSFKFYGVDYMKVYVSLNGYVSFTDSL